MKLSKTTRVLIVLAAIPFLAIFGIGGCIYWESRPTVRLPTLLGRPLPAGYRELAFTENFTLVDAHAYFRFRCSASEADKLITSLKAKEITAVKFDDGELLGVPVQEKMVWHETWENDERQSFMFRIGYDKDTEWLFGWIISYYDSNPED